MKTSFNTEFLKSNCGCYNKDGDVSKLQQAFTENGKECFDEESCETSLQEIMLSSIPTEDKYWFLSKIVLDVEERKELFLFVMSAVSEATDDITVKEYITTLIQYAAQETSWGTLYEAWKKTPRGGWVIDGYDCYCYSSPYLGFGLYQTYYLLAYLNSDKTTTSLVWNVVMEYIKNKLQ